MFFQYESAFVGVAMTALLRLDHRVRFYLWKACSEAKINPDDLLKTRLLRKTTYGGLLDLTRQETLEHPPQDLPPIQGELLEYARARTLTTPTPKVRRYFKQVLLHAEHRLFGNQPNFRDLQLGARFIPSQDWKARWNTTSYAHAYRKLVCFRSPPYGGEEVVPTEALAMHSYVRNIVLEMAKCHALDDANFLKNLIPLFNFELPHVEELLEAADQVEAAHRRYHQMKLYTNEELADGHYPWPFLHCNSNQWPLDKEEDSPFAYYFSDTDDHENHEDTDSDPEYTLDIKDDPMVGFRGVVQIPLLLVAHYMRKQLVAVLGKWSLGMMEVAIMHAIGSKEKNFEYMALKVAFRVLPAPAEARQVMALPVQLTWAQAMVDMPLTVGRALFAIGVDEVFQGDKKMQEAVEAAANASPEPFWKANFIGRGITCSKKGEIRLTNDKGNTIYHMLRQLKWMRSTNTLPAACTPYIPVFDFAMDLLRERKVV